MRTKLLYSFFKAVRGIPAEIRKARRVNKLHKIAFGNPTTEEGFAAQREALRELNLMERE